MSFDLEKYWERNVPTCVDPKDPTIQSLAYYPLRIIAAEWVKYVAVMHECLRGHEQRDEGDPALTHFDTRLQELQSWRRQTMLSQPKVRSILRLLQSWMTENPNDMSLLQPLATDFEHISTNIEELQTDHGMSRRQPAMSNASYGVSKSVVRVHCLTSFSKLEADVVETSSVPGLPPPLSSNLAQSDACVAVLLCLRDRCREGLNLLRCRARWNSNAQVPILRSVLLKAYTWRVNCGRVETCRCKLSTPRHQHRLHNRQSR